jgi:hypothetical protein
MKTKKLLIATAAVGASLILAGAFYILRTGESPKQLE